MADHLLQRESPGVHAGVGDMVVLYEGERTVRDRTERIGPEDFIIGVDGSGVYRNAGEVSEYLGG